jgi:hypothetical protein
MATSKKVKRPYMVSTETYLGWHETKEEAEGDYKQWIDFYTQRPGYGAREITLNYYRKPIKRHLITA